MEGGRHMEHVPYMILPGIEAKINDTLEVGNITYCWHDELTRYTWCHLEVNDYDVATWIVALLFILYGSTSLISIFGNSLVIWVVGTSQRMRNVTNYFIANLALSDVAISAFSTPFQFYSALTQRWNFPQFMCKFCPFALTLSVNVSIFTLLAISRDRYKAVMDPLGHTPSKTRAKLIIGLIWVVAFLIAYPNFQFHKFDYVYDDEGRGLKPFCSPEELSHSIVLYWHENATFNESFYGDSEAPTDKVIYLTDYQIYVAFLMAVQYVIPLVIVAYSHVRMGIKLWTNKTPGNADCRRDETILVNKKRFVKMMAIVVGTFGICWFPWHFFHCLGIAAPSVMRHDYIHFFFFVSHWFAMSNSCYNPFIYAIFSENFKREFRKKKQLFLQIKKFCSGAELMQEDEEVIMLPLGSGSNGQAYAGKALPNGLRIHVIGPKRHSTGGPDPAVIPLPTAVVERHLEVASSSIGKTLSSAA